MNSLKADILLYALGAAAFVLLPFIFYFFYKTIGEYYEVKRKQVGPGYIEHLDKVLRKHPETGMDIHPIETDRYCLLCGAAFPPAASTCPACGSGAGDLPPVKRAEKTGIVKHDLMVGDEVAFREGELVNIELVSLGPDGSEFEYVVISRRLNRSFHLSGDDLMT